MPIAEQIADIRPNPEAAEQLAGSSGTGADWLVAVVVADPGAGRGCSDLPRPASDSYLQCLLCRVGPDCTDLGLEQSAASVADTEYL